MLNVRQFMVFAVAAILLVTGYYIARQGHPDAKTGPHSTHEQATASTSLPADAGVAASNGKAFEVRIPVDVKAATPVYRLRKGDKASFSVVSGIDGKLAIHGLTDNLPIREGQTIQFNMLAQHTGRFPMHLHGRDGSHLEVGLVEIMPE